MRRTLLLDLDGTLVDSVPDLAASLNQVMARRDLAPLSRAAVARMVGDGVAALLARGFAARGRAPDAAAMDDFMAEYGLHLADATRPYPGALATLDALRAEGWTLAVCTNKPAALARRVLAATGLLPLIAAVGGGDSFPARKPDPAHLRATLALAAGEVAGAAMLGDHRNDIAAARAAGIPGLFAAWGYGEAAMADGAAAVAESFAALPPLLRRLRP